MKRSFHKKEGSHPAFYKDSVVGQTARTHFINGSGGSADLTPPPFFKDLLVLQTPPDPSRTICRSGSVCR